MREKGTSFYVIVNSVGVSVLLVIVVLYSVFISLDAVISNVVDDTVVVGLGRTVVVLHSEHSLERKKKHLSDYKRSILPQYH